MPKSSSVLKSVHGFTLVEVICVVVLMGILGAVGLAFMRDTTSTGRETAGITNARELNTAIANLRAASANFTVGTANIASGTATTPATVTLPASPATADIQAVITALRTGVVSYGQTSHITNAPTAASYNCTIGAGNVPNFTFKTGTGATP